LNSNTFSTFATPFLPHLYLLHLMYLTMLQPVDKSMPSTASISHPSTHHL